MNDFSKKLAELSPEQRSLLEQRLKQKGLAPRTQQPIPKRQTDCALPLSFAQQRLWFVQQFDRSSTAYNVSRAIQLEGQLNIPVLERSFNEVVRRHEILRTTFAATAEGQPVQIIAPSQPLSISILDLSGSAEIEQQVQQLATEEAHRPFNLTQAPLLRLTLLRLKETQFVLLITLHHIIFDGWSLGVLIREVMALYRSFLAGQPSPLPELPIQYADFALWQRQWLQGDVLNAQIDYWTHQLSGDIPVLQMPTDRPRPPVQTGRGAAQSFTLSPSLSKALKQLTQREGVTLFMTLLAAFKTLLYRYTNQEDLWIGSPIANRNRSELEGLIGFFVNTLVLRTHPSSHLSFHEFLGQVRQVALEAYAHQDLPFERLVEALQPKRDLSRNPLFQAAFALQNAATDVLELPGLHLHVLEKQSRTAKFDLDLSMQDTPQGLRGVLEYNTDLFNTDTIDRLIGHFKTLLAGIVANPNQRLSELPLLTPDEQVYLISGKVGNAEKVDITYPTQCCIHEWFEEQVERTPDTIALIFKEQQLTYAELNERSNRLAHFLRSIGVKPDTCVALYLERSIDLIVGMLGVLKAGGAYVPLDPTYPPERLAFMLKDSQAAIILSQQHLVQPRSPLQSSAPQIKTICLDADWETIAQFSHQNPVHQTTADHLAYVIYTSGSTGTPKGVMIPHGALVSYTHAAQQVYGLQSGDRILQFSSTSFDASVEEIYPCLTQGATLVLRTESMVASVAVFLQTCQDWGITVLSLPTAYWHELTAALGTEVETLPVSLRLVIIGGEAAHPDQFARWQQHVGQSVKLINTYGPTETTVVATLYDLSNITADSLPSSVPIGRPLPHVSVYILDRQLQPVPIGVPGELYIAGRGLARGYVNRPTLTAEKFIPNPFTPSPLTPVETLREPPTTPSFCLYKTGDLARYRSDGAIEFLGRLDAQIKLWGFRIELSEIEAALMQHPALRAAAVIVQTDDANHQHLIAYVVAHPGQSISPDQVRDFLRAKLPYYMLPARLVVLDALPLTPNGKIDRQALSHVDFTESCSGSAFVAPRTPTEATLAEIWADVLNVKQVSIHDNFFELGGHSLLVVRLLARLRDVFHVDLPLRCLFEAPTVASLATWIESAHQPDQAERHQLQPRIDLETEAVLEASINPRSVPFTAIPQPARILLTGATGFLGAFLLHELLQSTQATIYCLVRATNPHDAMQKIRNTLIAYLLWEDAFSSRIIPVMGDLSQPLLGLAEVDFRSLATALDVIYHNGAWVHHTYPYAALKATNVQGTQEVLRLATQAKIIPVHFISTISVFTATDSEEKTAFEDSLPEAIQVPANGYVQSKWVAERLVIIARDRGLPACIYRPGRISGDSQTGVFNANDFLYRLIIGCIQLGYVPNTEMMLDLIPVDYASRAIIHLSQQPSSIGKTFHLVNPKPLSVHTLVNWIRSFGYPLEQLAYDQWRTKLLHIASYSPDHPLYPIVSFFSAQNHLSRSPASSLSIDCQNTLQGLSGTPIACPPIDDSLLHTYFSYLIQNKLLNTPSAKTT